MDVGRFSAIAKGAKSNRLKGNAAILQPFRPLQIQWVGKGEVKTLTGYEAAGNPYTLFGQYLYCGLYINELLTRLLTRFEPYPNLFARYTEVMMKLESKVDLEDALRHFEVFLLSELGYGVALDWDSKHDCAVSKLRHYRYIVEQGAVLVDGPSNHTISGSTLLSLASGRQLQASQLGEARRLMRLILSHYLGDKPLKSRELFASKTVIKKRD